MKIRVVQIKEWNSIIK